MDVIPKRPDRSAKLDNDVTKPTFTPTLAGTYVLALTVNDGKKDSEEADSVTITVNAASTNTAPVAVAGTDQYVPVSSTNKITLTGSGSYDNDTGETATLTYKWYLSRPAADTTAVLSRCHPNRFWCHAIGNSGWLWQHGCGWRYHHLRLDYSISARPQHCDRTDRRHHCSPKLHTQYTRCLCDQTHRQRWQGEQCCTHCHHYQN